MRMLATGPARPQIRHGALHRRQEQAVGMAAREVGGVAARALRDRRRARVRRRAWRRAPRRADRAGSGAACSSSNRQRARSVRRLDRGARVGEQRALGVEIAVARRAVRLGARRRRPPRRRRRRGRGQRRRERPATQRRAAQARPAHGRRRRDRRRVDRRDARRGLTMAQQRHRRDDAADAERRRPAGSDQQLGGERLADQRLGQRRLRARASPPPTRPPPPASPRASAPAARPRDREHRGPAPCASLSAASSDCSSGVRRSSPVMASPSHLLDGGGEVDARQAQPRVGRVERDAERSSRCRASHDHRCRA